MPNLRYKINLNMKDEKLGIIYVSIYQVDETVNGMVSSLQRVR